MAKKALIAKQKREQKYKVREYNRCEVCGNPRGFMRKFKMCRKCFREFAHLGFIPGLKKSSW